VQAANGFDDSVENMIAYLTASMSRPDPAKIRAYCENSVAHFSWLEAQGVPFNEKFYPGKHVELPTDETLSYTGNEKAWPLNQKAKPAPRGHMVATQGAGGYLLIAKLIAAAEAAGVRFDYDANVNALVTNTAGRVVGVRYRRSGEVLFTAARCGVLLATGGFAQNRKMIEEFCPFMAREDVHLVGGAYSDGAGIRLGVGVGAVPTHMDGRLITSPIYPPESHLKGVLVNKLGRRFIPEDSYHGRTSESILGQPDQRAYLILDNSMYAPPPFGQQAIIDAWESVVEMEKDLGMPTGRLEETIAIYNRDAAHGEDTVQHKNSEWCQPLIDLPFTALDCSPGKSIWSGFTLGGLKTDVDARALNASGQAILGLYAAGATASNLAQDSLGYSSGVCIGESTYFARRAAASVARERVGASAHR
jgi:succinate dehydrogenase/fumarate reductase flavoprotein subunit